jgi:hypothetical protein
VFCFAAVVAWLCAWLAAFHNLYGWLVDDQNTFSRFQVYATGGENFLDISWFHAYMWFLMLPPLLFHWTIPSHVAARAYQATSQFRALILYTILLHALVLGLVAAFLRQLCRSAFVSGAAFLLVALSPTLALYTPFLDSRYLSLLAVLPALMLLIQGSRRGLDSSAAVLLFGFVPGLLLGIGEDIHYECLYLSAPFAALFWGMQLVGRWRTLAQWRGFLAFIAGLGTWVVPVQIISMLFHPFAGTYLGTLIAQYSRHMQPYAGAENIVTWWSLFLSEMGVPMMIAVAAGLVILTINKLRPEYVLKFDSLLIVACCGVFSLYLLVSQTFPFYRMVFGYQLFYALAACIFAERAARRVKLSAQFRVVLAALIVFVISIVPSMLRTPEVYLAQQGYGAAVNRAYADAGKGHVSFIDTFDDEANSKAIIDRAAFDRIPRRDDLVTYFPVSFHFKYPDLFALLENVRPVARYPTIWCTKEMWAQVPTFYGGRRWIDEPANCEARVYRVAEIRRLESRPTLKITDVRADSEATRSMGVRRILAKRTPSLGWHSFEMWNVYWDLWVSANTPGKHWVVIRFQTPERISRITLVPPEFRVPPDFIWQGRKRVSNIEIIAVTPSGRSYSVWSGSRLENRVIIKARFRAIVASSIRLELWQSPRGPNERVGLKYVYFPEYDQTTTWNNLDPPGRPGPGR